MTSPEHRRKQPIGISRPVRTLLIRKRRQRREDRPARQALQNLGWAGMVLALLLGLGMVGGLVQLLQGYQQLTADLPPIEILEVLLNSQTGVLLSPTVFYDRTGTEIIATLENPGISRQYLPLSDPQDRPILADSLGPVFVALFDPRFWDHPGADLREPLNPNPQTLAEGLVLRFLLEDEAPNQMRALRMRLLALQATARYGREQILTWHLNYTYFGHLAYGAESAAQLYFGKSAADISLGESLMLASAAQAPALNPLDAPEAALQQWESLRQILAVGSGPYAAPARELTQEDLSFAPPPPAPESIAQAFTQLVIDQLSESIGQDRLMRGGLQVITSLDADLQRQIACTVRAFATLTPQPDCPMAERLPERLFLYGQPLNPDAGLSIVIQDPQTGQILALLGDTKLNNAENDHLLAHETGSLLTPFIYLAGFQRGLGPASLVWDLPAAVPEDLAAYRQNPEDYLGPIRLREALALDALAPAAQILETVGHENVSAGMINFGLSLPGWEGLPYTGGPLSPLAISDAFAIFANQGVDVGMPGTAGTGHLAPIAWLSLQSKAGETLEENQTPTIRPVLSDPLAYLMNHILSDEAVRWAAFGHPNPTEIGRPAGFKSGLTADSENQWTVGYTPQRVVTIWMHNPGGQADPMHLAGLWHGIIQHSLEDLPVIGWRQPADIRTVTVCDPSGLLPTPHCPQKVSEVFLQGNEPQTFDTLFQAYEINQETGRLATVFTPSSLVKEAIFMEIPPKAKPWAEAIGLPQPPEAYDNLQAPEMPENVRITFPEGFELVSGTVPIQGVAAGPDFDQFQLAVGLGLNPQTWLQIGESSQSPLQEGLLVEWDTTTVPDGLVALRLQVIRKDQSLQTAILQVTVDNTPPQAEIRYPLDGQILPLDDDQPLLCVLEASDGVGIASVVWFMDGKFAARFEEPPYDLLWERSSGGHTLQVRVMDTAGNLMETDILHFSIGE